MVPTSSHLLGDKLLLFTIMKLLGQMPTYLREMLGVSKVVIYYVVGDEPTSPISLPPLQPNLIWSLENSRMMDELAAYTPHTGPSYESDNAQVYNLLDKALSGTNSIDSITRHQRRRDGRSVYLDIVTHNMGLENRENNAEQAESVLVTRI